jgi:hypothetical protein
MYPNMSLRRFPCRARKREAASVSALTDLLPVRQQRFGKKNQPALNGLPEPDYFTIFVRFLNADII